MEQNVTTQILSKTTQGQVQGRDKQQGPGCGGLPSKPGFHWNNSPHLGTRSPVSLSRGHVILCFGCGPALFLQPAQLSNSHTLPPHTPTCRLLPSLWMAGSVAA